MTSGSVGGLAPCRPHRFRGIRRTGVGAIADDGHHREREHHQRDVAMPAMPGAGFVVVEAELVLGGLKTVFDRPTMPLHRHQFFQRCANRTPGREEGEIAVGDVAADQQPTGPDAGKSGTKIIGVKISEFEIGPVMQSRALGELLSNLVFEGCRSCGDLVWVCGFNSVFERVAGDDFGEVIKAA